MATKRKRKTTKKSKKKSNSKKSSLQKHFKNSKFKFISGLIIIAFAFFLSIAFISFFSTGYADQSKFDIPLWELFKSSEIKVENITGK